MEIRPATAGDVPSLLQIYNHYVEHTHITFDLEPVSLAARMAWFEGFDASGPHRLFVACEEDDVIGYASSGVFRKKPAYARSVETSVYLAHDRVGRGAGKALYLHLFDVLAKEPEAHRAYGGVALPNDASIALHLRCGFEETATFSEVGFKFGQYWDVTWYERAL
ncbi:MAG: N-acetyltransferase family protein [Myxococcota bacterium]